MLLILPQEEGGTKVFLVVLGSYIARIRTRVQRWHGHGYVDTAKLKKHRIRDTSCIYMLSLKLSTNTLSTNTKMNQIYLSNIQYAKNSDKIRFVPYFNHQNHVKDKKVSFRLDIMYPTNIVQVSVSDTYQTRDTLFMRSFMRRVGAS